MSISSKIREQIISSFRAELADHVQSLNDGLLAIEQSKVSGDAADETLASIFRAAHSLKGAARAVGVTAVEQLAHSLEDVLGSIQKKELAYSPELFTACYHAVDAIQLVQAAYDEGKLTPPVQVLHALAELDAVHTAIQTAPPVSNNRAMPASPTPEAQDEGKTAPQTVALEKKAPNPEGNLKKLFSSLGDMVNGAENMEHPLSGQVQTAVAAPPAQFAEKPQHAAQAGDLAYSAQTDAAGMQHGTPDETIRVSVSKLDALMAQLSELLVTKIRLEQRLDQVQQAQGYMSQWQKEWLAERGTYARLIRQDFGKGDNSALAAQKKDISHLLGYIDGSQVRMREMMGMVNNLAREFNSDAMQMSLAIDSLEDDIKRVRMLPFSTITASFSRMVRDLAMASGKDAVLEIIGGDVELDKRVLEQIKDPITHLLRNAIDHGIELPEKRIAAGKPACGKITLSAAHQGKDVAISIADDGNGVDIEAIRHTAIRRNIPNAPALTDAEIIELIYSPGFSTSVFITDVSGRGVGLDVVRRNVELLRGRITLDWKPGQGAQFTLLIPLALTSSRGLLVRASNQLFAIPLNAIVRIENVKTSDILQIGGHDTLQYEGRPLILADLAAVLNLPASKELGGKDRVPVVILSAAERRMAFVVDGLADEQEVVIKGLGKQLTRVAGIVGASVMGNGEVILILNVADLIKLAQRGDHSSILERQEQKEETVIGPEKPRRKILVVDDSITTRTLEKNILEAAGHEVQLATDGMEAFRIVSSGDLPQLIISDVSMPRLDGFGLTQLIKGGGRTAHIPVILVTSLDSPEDKTKGIECGADAYIVKSSFDQNNLLETIEQLL